jgi:hypothetical protein
MASSFLHVEFTKIFRNISNTGHVVSKCQIKLKELKLTIFFKINTISLTSNISAKVENFYLAHEFKTVKFHRKALYLMIYNA